VVYTTNPSKDHYNKALYVVRYLTGTRKYSLAYDGNTQYGLLTYMDSDWASDQTTCRSQTSVNVVLRGELSGERSGVREYAPGSNRVAEQYGDPVGV
jgi:hypothetical protein